MSSLQSTAVQSVCSSMSDNNITDGLIKMSFNENDSDSEAENGQEDIEAMKANIKAQQKKLSAVQNRARKSKTKPVNHPKKNYVRFAYTAFCVLSL